MSIILLSVLIAAAVAMLVWGFRCRARMLQFPTLASAAWLFFVIPQAIGVIRNPAAVPPRALDDHGIEMALLMSILMAAFGFVGYMRPIQIASAKRWSEYHTGRLFWGGALLIAISLVGFHKLAMLSGGYVAHFSVRGNYGLTWSGLPVAYWFFAGLVYPGLTICLLCCLKQPSCVRWITVVAGSVFPLAAIILLGRRSQLVALVAVIGSSLYFARRWAPPRWLTVVAFAAGGALIVLAPKVRNYTQLGSDHQRLTELQYKEEVSSAVAGGHYSEFVYPVVVLSAVQAEDAYGYGRWFYNGFVHQWVPRLIVGNDFKESLYLDIPWHSEVAQSYCGWRYPSSSFPTGIAELFFEFGYFGSILFYWMAQVFRRIWERAAAGNTAAQVYYAWALPYALSTVTTGVLGLPGDALYFTVFVLPILQFARVTNHSARRMRERNAPPLPYIRRTESTECSPP